MHGSLGHFKDTLNRRKLRKEKKQGKFEDKSSDHNYSNPKPEYNFPEVSNAKLERIKEEIRRDSRSRKLKQYIILVVIAMTLFILLFLID